jgi:hypothetical protein
MYGEGGEIYIRICIVKYWSNTIGVYISRIVVHTCVKLYLMGISLLYVINHGSNVRMCTTNDKFDKSSILIKNVSIIYTLMTISKKINYFYII